MSCTIASLCLLVEQPILMGRVGCRRGDLVRGRPLFYKSIEMNDFMLFSKEPEEIAVDVAFLFSIGESDSVHS